MSLRMKMIYGCLTGAWGGFLAWLLLDRVLHLAPTNPYLDAIVNGALVGVCVGAFIGGYAGVVEQNAAQTRRGLRLGCLTGLVGGVVGLLVGEVVFQLFAQATPVRALGWAIFGIAIGVGEGLWRSWRRVVFGLVGGAVGGVLGSLALVAVKQALVMPGFSRALGFTILGALVGLFIGLVPVIVTPWLGRLKVVSSGRNEGKEILLDKTVIQIGRDDRCDLPLYGDSDIQPRHAELRREPQGYVVRPLGGASIQVNGQPVTTRRLVSGDRIQLGGNEVLFDTER